MAQPQAQARDSSTREARSMTNMPARQSRSSQLSRRDPMMGWAAAEPFGLMRRLTDDMDQLFGQLLGGTASRGGLPAANPVVLARSAEWVPPLEIFERDGKLVVQADVPGVAADDVTVEIADGVLTISGERREEREIDDGSLRRTERVYGTFSRSIALPEGARAEEIQASCQDGVLEITVPLQQETPSRRTIDVQSTRSDAAASSASAGRQASSNAGGIAGGTAGESQAKGASSSPQTASTGA